MKPKQTLKFLFLNILGFSLIPIGYFFLMALNPIYFYSLLGVGILLIGWSFKTALVVKEDGVIPPISEASAIDKEILTPQTQSMNHTNFASEARNENQDVLKDETATEFQPYQSHYDSWLNPTKGTTLLQVEPLEFLSSNLESILDAMNVYGKVHENPYYTYRFEALIKLNVEDQILWKHLYDEIPYLKIVEQKMGDKSIYLLKASVNNRNYLDLAYLPDTWNSLVHNESIISATLMGGSAHILDKNNANLRNETYPYKILLNIK